MKLEISLVCGLLLVGCISVPKSTSELKQKAYAEHKVCLNENSKKVFELVSRRMNQCYGNAIETTTTVNGTFISTSSQFIVESKYNEGGISTVGLILNAPGIYGYTGAVQISESVECKSDVRIFFHNSMWDSHSTDIKSWLDGDLKPCSGNGT
jgi:hypothetical protein